jgi:hypothetical protein
MAVGWAGKNVLISTDPASAVAGDFTAICVLSHNGTWDEATGLPVVEVSHLERQQKMHHQDIIARVNHLADWLHTEKLTATPSVVYDANGLGRPIVERARENNSRPVYGFIATGSEDGRSDRFDDETQFFYASKLGHLVALDAASQAGRLLIPAGLKLGSVLEAEAESLRATLSRAGRIIVSEPNSQLSQFDDLLNAVSMAVTVTNMLWTKSRIQRLRGLWPDRLQPAYSHVFSRRN